MKTYLRAENIFQLFDLNKKIVDEKWRFGVNFHAIFHFPLISRRHIALKKKFKAVVDVTPLPFQQYSPSKEYSIPLA